MRVLFTRANAREGREGSGSNDTELSTPATPAGEAAGDGQVNTEEGGGDNGFGGHGSFINASGTSIATLNGIDEPEKVSDKGKKRRESLSGVTIPRKLVRAYLEDDVVLRALGLHNTFKTLVVYENTPIRLLCQMMIQKMSQTLSGAQHDLILQTCMHYYFFLVTLSGMKTHNGSQRK